MQGIEAAQVVVKSEPWRVLDEVLVYLYDAKGWPLLSHCLCCAVPAVRPTARTVSTKPMRQMYQAFCCLHLGADKITAGLRHLTLDQCAGIEAKAV